MKRSRPMRRTAIRSRRRRPPMDPVLRRAVYLRDEGRCQMCAGYVAEDDCEVHHRQLRSQGGPDSLANLVTLCRADHHAVHANPQKSRERGFICPGHESPERWPVLRFLGSWEQPGTTWTLPADHPAAPDYPDGAA